MLTTGAERRKNRTHSAIDRAKGNTVDTYPDRHRARFEADFNQGDKRLIALALFDASQKPSDRIQS